MPEIRSHGVRIHYETAGAGEPLVLVHGYTASADTNWRRTGWLSALSSHYRLIVPDLRGHGLSEKPHSSSDYSLPLLAGDVLSCMDAERVTSARVFGYSMGGMITLELLLNHPSRVAAAVIGGMGSRWPDRGERRQRMRYTEPGAPPAPPRRRRSLGFFASYLRHYDPLAMRAVWHGVFRGNPPVDGDRLGEIHVPVLVVAGMRDGLYPGAKELAEHIPGARFVGLSERGHLAAIGDPRFKQAVLEFFAAPERVAGAVSE
jgi:pimeloyl-ACP methyl ester carboxylesterase